MKKGSKEMAMKEMNRGYKCKEPFGTLKLAQWKQKWKKHWTGTLNDRDGRGKCRGNLPLLCTQLKWFQKHLSKRILAGSTQELF